MSRRPPFDVADAVRLAAEIYGVEARASELASDSDRNFLLEHPGDRHGRRSVLKIAQGTSKRAIVEAESSVLEHLERAAPELPCPRLLRSLGGRTVERATSTDGQEYPLRRLSFLPGRHLADVVHTPALLRSFGATLGRLDRELSALDLPALRREMTWDLARAETTLSERIASIEDEPRRAQVEKLAARTLAELEPHRSQLRRSLIHGDANDYNVLVPAVSCSDGVDRFAPTEITGLLDFGDLVETFTVCDPAIALAYLLHAKDDPLVEAAPFLGGYHQAWPLREGEIAAIFPFALLRLCVSVTMSAHQRRLEPDNEYLSISEAPAWRVLDLLEDFHPRRAEWILRRACGLEPCRGRGRVVAALEASDPAPVLGFPLTAENTLTVDCSLSSPIFTPIEPPREPGADPMTETIDRALRHSGRKVAWGRYDEARPIYAAPQFVGQDAEGQHNAVRTVHLGVDLAIAPGTPVHAAYDAVIHSVRDNAQPGDYGPTVILEHRLPAASDTPFSDAESGCEVVFWTLYGHLSRESIRDLEPGQSLGRGAVFAAIGDPTENGGWWPHLHFQVITDLLVQKGDFPGVAPTEERECWLSANPDPNLVLRLPEEVLAELGPAVPDSDDLLARRRRVLSLALSLSYRDPLHIVRGQGAYLFDPLGRHYLDLVNNVCHIGHSHPKVVRAAAQQMAVLNTNSRYLHRHLVSYAERLLATFPGPLAVCFFVNSGSEANDLALRLARRHTGRQGVVCLEGAYHGHLTSLIEVSPYKHSGPGGEGAPDFVHVAALPDVYRGRYRAEGAAASYATDVTATVARAAGHPAGLAAFLAESLISCGGQIVPPEGYLEAAYRATREAGGVAIADEVQVGFGRVGSHVWGFETHGVVPDIVTLGKPIGNGHPLAAVITTREIADTFANGMEYFNTYGGNPVSCTVGLAVLDVIEEEGLQQRAHDLGHLLLTRLRELRHRYPFLGDVRGRGLFLGIELVRLEDGKPQNPPQPDPAVATFLVERMRHRGFLLSTDGPDHNVIKIKPPLAIAEDDVARFLATLERTLEEVARSGG